MNILLLNIRRRVEILIELLINEIFFYYLIYWLLVTIIFRLYSSRYTRCKKDLKFFDIYFLYIGRLSFLYTFFLILAMAVGSIYLSLPMVCITLIGLLVLLSLSLLVFG